MKLSILIPTFNEERTILELLNAVQAVQYPFDYEIIIIDDASVDRTYEKELIYKLKHKEDRRIRIFKNRINRGKGFSIRKGIRRAKGDIIIVQDADNEYNPQDIPRLLELMQKENAHVVYGSRFLAKRFPDGMAFPNWFANQLLTAITNLMFGLQLTDMETCYKMFRANVVKNLPLTSNRFSFEPEVTAWVAIRKFKIVETPIFYNGRTAKKGKKIKARDFFFAILMLLKCRWLGFFKK